MQFFEAKNALKLNTLRAFLRRRWGILIKNTAVALIVNSPLELQLCAISKSTE